MKGQREGVVDEEMSASTEPQNNSMQRSSDANDVELYSARVAVDSRRTTGD